MEEYYKTCKNYFFSMQNAHNGSLKIQVKYI